MKQKTLNLVKSLLFFEWLLIALIALCLSVTVLSAFHVRPYTSDDVSIQNTMLAWRHHEPLSAVQSTDTWILKTPLYALDSLFFSPGRGALLFENLVCGAVLMGGIVFFIRRTILPRANASRLNLLAAYLPVAWFLVPVVAASAASYSGARTLTLMNADLRNAELGIALVLISLFSARFPARRTRQDKSLSWPVFGLFGVLAGLLIYDDPYFLYTFLVPGAGLIVLYFMLRRAKLQESLRWLGLAAAAAAAYLAFRLLAHAAGIVALDNVARSLAPLSQLNNHLQVAAQGAVASFGAHFWGSGKVSLPGLFDAAVGLLCLAAFSLGLLSKKLFDQPDKVFLALISLVTFAVFVLSTANNAGSERYLIFMVLALLLMLSILSTQLKNTYLKLFLISVVGISLVLNLADNARSLQRNLHANPNKNSVIIISQVEREGLSKGYAPYWDANINTYLSAGRLHFLPVICNGQSLRKMKWLINSAEFNLPAKRSFFLFDKVPSAPYDLACTGEQLTKASGITPLKTVNIGDRYILYIYQGDIGTKFGWDNI